MRIHQLGEFKHGDLRFAAKERLELVIGVDVTPVLSVLEVVLTDVLHTRLVISVRGSGREPTTAASTSSGCTGLARAPAAFPLAVLVLGMGPL
jgi:hypothetical protein